MLISKKTQKQIDAGNQYHSYKKGWAAGACVRSMDPAFSECENPLIKDAYDLGYMHGRAARQGAWQFASEQYGHKPEILRLQDTNGANEGTEAVPPAEEPNGGDHSGGTGAFGGGPT